MKYITLDKIRNAYPLDKQKQGGVISQTYFTKPGGIIANEGEGPIPAQYPPGPRQRTNSSDIISVPGTNFRFVINIDGVRYTSPQFASDLQKAIEESNPYFNESTVTTISFSSTQISTPPRNYEVGLLYAETTIQPGNNLYNGDPISIIKYIDSLVQPTTGRGTAEISDAKTLGSWKTNISKYSPATDTGMGMEFTDLLEDEKNEGKNK